MYVKDPYILVFLFLSFQALFFSIIFLFKKRGNYRANKILSTFLLVYCFHLLINCSYWQGLLNLPPYTFLSTVSNISWLSYGPLLYLYFISLLFNIKFKYYHLLLFLPVVVYLICFYPYLALSPEMKLSAKLSIEGINSYILFFNYKQFIVFRSVVNFIFLLLIFKLFINYRKDSPQQKNIQLWTLCIVFSFLLFIAKNLVHSHISIPFIENSNVLIENITFTLPIIIIVYFAFYQAEIFQGLPVQKLIPFKRYQRARLSESFSVELKEKLTFLMVNDKIYMQNDLNLNKLSDLLNIDKHSTSELINLHYNKSVSEFINSYRINESVNILSKNKDEKISFINIAYDVGFNTRASFNSAFKKYTGMTPSNYIRNLKT